MTLLSAEFLIPYQKGEIINKNTKQTVYKEFLGNLIKAFSITNISKVTFIKSYVSKQPHKPEKKLECIRVIAPNSLENDFKNLLLNGIPYKERVIHAFQNSDVNSSIYPKQFTLKFRNLPHFLEDKEILASCNLQSYKISKLRHQKERISSDMEVYTGICYADIEVRDSNQLEQLKLWNKKAFLKAFDTNEIPFNCYVQTLLQCDYCKQEKVRFMGHHENQCKIKKKQPNTVSEDDEVSSSSNEEMSDAEAAQTLRQDTNIFYIDVEKNLIKNVSEMERLHKRFISDGLGRIQRRETFDIVDARNTVVNQLRHVVLLNNEMDQRKLFDNQSLWKHKSSNVFIKNFDEFSALRNKLDVYYDSTDDDESIYLVNLWKTITYTLKKRKIKTPNRT